MWGVSSETSIEGNFARDDFCLLLSGTPEMNPFKNTSVSNTIYANSVDSDTKPMWMVATGYYFSREPLKKQHMNN